MSPKPSSKFKTRPVCLVLQILKNFIPCVTGRKKKGSNILNFACYGRFCVLFPLCTAHSSYPGVLEPFHPAVCVCPCSDLVRHTHVPHRPGSPGNHVLLHPEVFPSRIPVRAQTSVVLAMEMSPAVQNCSAGELCFKLGPVKAVALSESGTNPLQGHFTSAFDSSSSSRASARHEQGLCAWSKVFGVYRTQKNPAGFCPPQGYVQEMRQDRVKSACPGESGNM